MTRFVIERLDRGAQFWTAIGRPIDLPSAALAIMRHLRQHADGLDPAKRPIYRLRRLDTQLKPTDSRVRIRRCLRWDQGKYYCWVEWQVCDAGRVVAGYTAEQLASKHRNAIIEGRRAEIQDAFRSTYP